MPTLENKTQNGNKTHIPTREDRIRQAQATRTPRSMRTHWYFAYGSNLNKSQMQARCRSSRPAQRLVLPNWQLVFRGVADIVERPGSHVIGALHQIQQPDEIALDIYEGYRNQSPDVGLYRKVYVEAVDTKTGNAHEIMFYVMNHGAVQPPSRGYLKTIYQGYQDWNLDTQTLEEAVEGSYKASYEASYKASYSSATFDGDPFDGDPFYGDPWEEF